MAKAPSTTDLVQIQQIVDGVILLKDGSLRGLVQVDAINFELRSGEEQTAILQQFQAFLNTIDFPIEMVVQSRKFDITMYLNTIQEASSQLQNELLKVQAEEYMRFVSELSELANIMAKRFYIALPFTVVQKVQKEGIISGITGLFKKKTPAEKVLTPEQVSVYKTQLQQRADIILGGLSGLGLRGRMLEQEELTSLFKDLYNPSVPAPRQKEQKATA